jgi:hypothetical protein
MHSFYTIVALDLARERTAEADAYRLAALSRAGSTDVGIVRRIVARVAFAIARAADEQVDQRVSLTTH